jgi:hypothetical protein
MDDSEAPLTNGIFNAISRIESRVAALEARNGAEIAGLKRDTEAIRQSGHEIGNTLTAFIASSSADRMVMRGHMEECAKRAARQEWYGRLILTAMVGTLAFFIKAHFFPALP